MRTTCTISRCLRSGAVGSTSPTAAADDEGPMDEEIRTERYAVVWLLWSSAMPLL